MDGKFKEKKDNDARRYYYSGWAEDASRYFKKDRRTIYYWHTRPIESVYHRNNKDMLNAWLAKVCREKGVGYVSHINYRYANEEEQGIENA